MCLFGSASGREGERETEERWGEGERGTMGGGENIRRREEEEDCGRGAKNRKKSKLSGVGGVEQVEREGEGSTNEEDKRLHFVKSLSEMFSALTKQPQMSLLSDLEECSSMSLTSILGRMTPVFVHTLE